MLCTLCASTACRTSVSCFRFFRSSATTTGSSSAFAARRFLPATSSAMRCWRSAGVSVHRLLGAPRVAELPPRENCRAFSFVGSVNSALEELVFVISRELVKKAHFQGGQMMMEGPASTRHVSVSSASQLPMEMRSVVSACNMHELHCTYLNLLPSPFLLLHKFSYTFI